MKQVAAGIVFHEDRLLVARRGAGQNLAGYWEFPGGKLEGSETPQECVAREIEEELSLIVRPGSIFCESPFSYPGGAINLIAVLATADRREVELSVHDEVRWLRPDELSCLRLAPADVAIADRLATNGRTDEGATD